MTFTADGAAFGPASRSYSWSFGDGTSASGGTASHTYSAIGTYTIILTVTDSGGFATASQSITVLGAPSVPVVTASTSSTVPGATVSLSASSTDPQGSALAYSWDFGDGATANGASVTHTYSAGVFSPRVTASNALGLSTSATASTPIRVGYLPMGRPSIFHLNENHLLGQAYVARAAALEPNGLPMTYSWDFGDGTSHATELYSYHTYGLIGTYTVTLTVTSSASSVSSQTTVKVLPPGSLPQLVDNVLAPYCAGTFCGAVNSTTYSGNDVGIWRYHNATASSANIDIAIAGVRAGQLVALTFTNAQPVDAADVPGVGTLMSMSTPGTGSSILDAGGASPDAAGGITHQQTLERNVASAQSFLAGQSAAPRRATIQSLAAVQAAAATPAVGATKTWTDVLGNATLYQTEVAATCPLPTGRNAVFWLDTAQLASGQISRAKIDYLVNGFCGPAGAYARLVAMVGDLWGAAAAGSGYIQDTPSQLLDVNIVLPGVPSNTTWGGYFSAVNLQPSSNAALAIFLNPRNIVVSPNPDPFVGSSLIHELKHHINYYQRTIVRGVIHPVWLEETSAMLAEDALTPAVFGASRSEARQGGYIVSGGNVGYIGWTAPEGGSYNLGAVFGAFWHRLYGFDIDRRLMDTCSDDGTPLAGYQCVDTLIIGQGGAGFADHFERLGATIFGGVGRSEMPTGFGLFPIEREGLVLDSLNEGVSPFPPPAPLANGYRATTHTYRHDTVGAGETIYKRNGVLVPAGTTLIVVIQ